MRGLEVNTHLRRNYFVSFSFCGFRFVGFTVHDSEIVPLVGQQTIHEFTLKRTKTNNKKAASSDARCLLPLLRLLLTASFRRLPAVPDVLIKFKHPRMFPVPFERCHIQSDCNSILIATLEPLAEVILIFAEIDVVAIVAIRSIFISV